MSLKKLLTLIFMASLGLALIAFTPISRLWFEEVSGLSQALSAFSVLPVMILSAIPALSVLLSLQRAILVKARRTWPVTVATLIEISGIVAILFLGIHGLDMVGAVAAAAALLGGRIFGNLYLIRPCAAVIRGS